MAAVHVPHYHVSLTHRIQYIYIYAIDMSARFEDVRALLYVFVSVVQVFVC